MKKTLRKYSDHYQLHISYTVPKDRQAVWNLLTTHKGIEEWFPQLSRTGDSLLFSDESFQEKLRITAEKPLEHFTFDWFGARISFALQETKKGSQLDFTEELPLNFPHPQRDLSGWVNQNYRIADYLNNKEWPDMMTYFEESQDWINQQMR